MWCFSGSCCPANRKNCWQSFLWSYKFFKSHGVWVTDQPDRGPCQSTDASDMTGPAMLSLAMRAWLNQVIARMKDWVLLSTWHTHLTHLSAPLPLLNSQTIAAPLLLTSSKGNPGLKMSFPLSSLPPLIKLFCPLLLPSPEEVSGSVGISHRSPLPVAGWFPPTGPSPLLKLPPCRRRMRYLITSTYPPLCIHF